MLTRGKLLLVEYKMEQESGKENLDSKISGTFMCK